MIHQLSLSESRIPLSGWGYELLCLLTCWFATMKIYCVAPRIVTNLCEEGMWQKVWGKKLILDGLLFKDRDLEVNLCFAGVDWPFAWEAQCLWHSWLWWWQWGACTHVTPDGELLTAKHNLTKFYSQKWKLCCLFILKMGGPFAI